MKTSPWKKIKKCKYLYIMMLLPIIYYILFHYLPLYGVLIAFKDYKIAKGVWGSPWVGFKWFEKFLADPYFWKLVKNTLLLNIYGLLWGFPVPILLALMLNEVTNAKFKRAIQTVSYLPHFISTVVVCGMVMNFLSLDGIINQIIAAFGFDKIQFMVLPEWFRTIFTASGIWQTCGWTSIIYLSALTSVDQEILEAAMIDGCNPLQTYFRVVFPILKPTAITVAILNVMWIWNDFLLPYLVIGISTRYKTIPVVIQMLVGTNGNKDLGALMAMLVLSIVPIVIFYMACQKYIIEGVVAGAVKG